jgi:hypothetical protein
MNFREGLSAIHPVMSHKLDKNRASVIISHKDSKSCKNGFEGIKGDAPFSHVLRT